MIKIKDINKNKSIESNTVIVIGLLIFHHYFFIENNNQNNILIYISFLILLCSVFFSPIGKIITFLWLNFSLILGWVNSRIILGLVYFIILSPLAFFYRRLNKNGIKIKNNKTSFYVTRNHKYTSIDLTKPW